MSQAGAAEHTARAGRRRCSAASLNDEPPARRISETSRAPKRQRNMCLIEFTFWEGVIRGKKRSSCCGQRLQLGSFGRISASRGFALAGAKSLVPKHPPLRFRLVMGHLLVDAHHDPVETRAGPAPGIKKSSDFSRPSGISRDGSECLTATVISKRTKSSAPSHLEFSAGTLASIADATGLAKSPRN